MINMLTFVNLWICKEDVKYKIAYGYNKCYCQYILIHLCLIFSWPFSFYTQCWLYLWNVHYCRMISWSKWIDWMVSYETATSVNISTKSTLFDGGIGCSFLFSIQSAKASQKLCVHVSRKGLPRSKNVITGKLWKWI